MITSNSAIENSVMIDVDGSALALESIGPAVDSVAPVLECFGPMILRYDEKGRDSYISIYRVYS